MISKRTTTTTNVNPPPYEVQVDIDGSKQGEEAAKENAGGERGGVQTSEQPASSFPSSPFPRGNFSYRGVCLQVDQKEKEQYQLGVESAFSPMLSSPVLSKISRSKVYTYGVIFVTVLFTVEWILLHFVVKRESIVSEFISALVLAAFFLFVCVELSKCDKHLFKLVLRSFDWWYITINMIGYVVCVIISNANGVDVRGREAEPFNYPCFKVYADLTILFGAYVFYCSFDAFPFTSLSIKRGVLVCPFVFYGLQFFAEFEIEEQPNVVNVCALNMCYTTRKMAMICITNVTIFLAKIQLSLLFFPKRMSIIKAHYVLLLSQQGKTPRSQEEGQYVGADLTGGGGNTSESLKTPSEFEMGGAATLGGMVAFADRMGSS